MHPVIGSVTGPPVVSAPCRAIESTTAKFLTLCPAGWIFIILAVTGVRGKLIQLAPRSLMLATSAGIGMFLAFIGLQTSNGLGVVTYESATLVTLGACPMADREHSFTGPVSSLFPSLLCQSQAK